MLNSRTKIWTNIKKGRSKKVSKRK